jgi:hypothetical protein
VERRKLDPEVIAIKLRRYLVASQSTNLKERFLAAKAALYLATKYPDVAAEVLAELTAGTSRAG